MKTRRLLSRIPLLMAMIIAFYCITVKADVIERATISAVKLNGGKTFTNIVAGEERNQGMMFKAGDTLSLSFSISNLTDTPKSMLLYGTTERMGSLGNKESSGLYITFVFSNGQWILDPSDYWNQNGFPDCLKKDSVKLSNSGNSYTFSGLVQDGELDRIDRKRQINGVESYMDT